MAEAIAEPAEGFPEPDAAPGGSGGDVEAEAEEADDMACMAADWLSLLAAGPGGLGPAQAGIAGLAAAVAVCCCTRCAPVHAGRWLWCSQLLWRYRDRGL